MLKILTLKAILSLVIYLLMISQAMAATISYVNVDNKVSRSVVTLRFNSVPIYTLFLLHHPERVVVDIHKSCLVQGLPLNFRGDNLIKRIRTSTPIGKRNLRLVFELTGTSRVQAMVKKIDRSYNVILIITKRQPTVISSNLKQINDNTMQTPAIMSASLTSSSKNKAYNKRITMTVEDQTSVSVKSRHISANGLVVVAIDAGHGGQDPGAKGPNGLYEKNVTIAIARKLKALLDIDPMFKPFLTREGDDFIPVMGRSDLARKKCANVLVSIHADAAPNLRASGASVWVISNRRVNSETANWLEQHEKQSELLGGGSYLLANSKADPYLSHTVLDLQFGHSQRVSYGIALNMLNQLQKVSTIHKHRPEYASLGVLRSPDIPSLLVETGFISNVREEQLLGNNAYQEKIANALHLGLRSYFLAHPMQTQTRINLGRRSQDIHSDNETIVRDTLVITQSNANMQQDIVECHTVQYGDTLFGLAKSYGVNLNNLRLFNKLRNDSILVGQKLYIPASNAMSVSSSAIVAPQNHKVVRGDTLTMLSIHYGVSASSIIRANNMKSNNIILGQILIIPLV